MSKTMLTPRTKDFVRGLNLANSEPGKDILRSIPARFFERIRYLVLAHDGLRGPARRPQQIWPAPALKSL